MSVQLRPATIDDLEQVFKWRNDPWIISLSSGQHAVSWAEHVSWFRNTLNNEDKILKIIEIQPGIEGGIVRLDRIDKEKALVSIYLLREHTGRGFGLQALVKGCAQGFVQWSIEAIYACIRKDNYPSLSAFTKAGFTLINSGSICPKHHNTMTLKR